MNNKLFVLSACMLAMTSSAAIAQDSVIYLDVRPNDQGSTVRTITGVLGATTINPFLNAAGNGDALNGGRRGQGQTAYLEPRHADGWESENAAPNAGHASSFPSFDGDLDLSTNDLWIYMDVNDDPSGTGDVISSVGLNIDTRFVASTHVFRNKLDSLVVTLDNGPSVFNSITPPGTGTPWSKKVDGNTITDGEGLVEWEKAKAARVPVENPGPVYNAALGIEPRAQDTTPSYRLGKIRMTAALRNCTQRIAGENYALYSTFEFFLKVNNLKITRVYNGTGDTQENVSFGYSGASPELPAVNGNDFLTGVSAVADGRAEVRMKGDFNGDGNVTNGDVSDFQLALNDPAENQLQAYLGDFNGSNTTTNADVGTLGAGGLDFLHAQFRSATCP